MIYEVVAIIGSLLFFAWLIKIFLDKTTMEVYREGKWIRLVFKNENELRNYLRGRAAIFREEEL